jgi:hypothetical protein
MMRTCRNILVHIMHYWRDEGACRPCKYFSQRCELECQKRDAGTLRRPQVLVVAAREQFNSSIW